MDGPTLAVAAALWTQGALVFVLLGVLYVRRVPRVMKGEIAVAEVALSKDAWPEAAKKAGNAYQNQFELPVLFFVAGAGALWLGPTLIEAVLAWMFVASRIVHAGIHVTVNAVVPRFAAFVAGCAVMAAFWVDLGVRVLLAAAG